MNQAAVQHGIAAERCARDPSFFEGPLWRACGSGMPTRWPVLCATYKRFTLPTLSISY